MSNADFRWVATTSDGTTYVEHTGEYVLKPGERMPWVRLTRDLAAKGEYITSLRLNFKGRTIHMPRPNFGKFGLDDKVRSPLFYSLQYMIERDMGGEMVDTEFVDLIAHYPTFEVHYVQDTTDGNNSWVIVTEGSPTMAPSPRIQSE